MKSARSPLHPEALTIDDLFIGQEVVCVRYSGGQPMNLMDESSYKTVRVVKIMSDHVSVRSIWLSGEPFPLDAQEYGLIHNESRTWSISYCVLTRESFHELREAQRANYTHPVKRGAMKRQLLPMG